MAIPLQFANENIESVSADKFITGDIPSAQVIALNDGATPAVLDFGDSWIFGHAALGYLYINPKVTDDSKIYFGTGEYEWASIWIRAVNILNLYASGGAGEIQLQCANLTLTGSKSGTDQVDADADEGDIWWNESTGALHRGL